MGHIPKSITISQDMKDILDMQKTQMQMQLQMDKHTNRIDVTIWNKGGYYNKKMDVILATISGLSESRWASSQEEVRDKKESTDRMKENLIIFILPDDEYADGLDMDNYGKFEPDVDNNNNDDKDDSRDEDKLYIWSQARRMQMSVNQMHGNIFC